LCVGVGLLPFYFFLQANKHLFADAQRFRYELKTINKTNLFFFFFLFFP